MLSASDEAEAEALVSGVLRALRKPQDSLRPFALVHSAVMGAQQQSAPRAEAHNALEEAQKTSALYDRSVTAAPSLKGERRTVARLHGGLLDIKVSLLSTSLSCSR